jgi:hypothetical protein
VVGATDGVENTVKLAKADIVPTDTNRAEQYSCFADLEAAYTGLAGPRIELDDLGCLAEGLFELARADVAEAGSI